MHRTPLQGRWAAQLVGLCAVAGLGACSSVSDSVSSSKIDYKSAQTKGVSLEVPPDLTQLSSDPRYQQPAAGSVVSAASLQKAPAPTSVTSSVAPATVVTPAATGTALTAAPVGNTELRIERVGNQRWLVTRLTPEQLWPQLRGFWQASGLALVVDQPELGIMETDWAENRAKIPQDFIRRSIGKVLDGLYDSSQRDRYHTRVERTPQGTEIYISHRSLVEQVVSGSSVQTPQTRWVAGPNDPNLEAEFLGRLMVQLSGGDTANAKTTATAVETVTKAPPTVAAKARILNSTTAATLQVDDGFERAWRRVSLSLDRSGFTVEDRDRKAGFFDIRYVDPKYAGTEEPGFFSRMFGAKDEGRAGIRYRLKVTGENNSSSLVTVHNPADGQGKTDTGAYAVIQALLNDLR